MSGVTTSSLSLAWSLRNWVILDYEEPNGLTVRPWAPFLSLSRRCLGQPSDAVGLSFPLGPGGTAQEKGKKERTVQWIQKKKKDKEIPSPTSSLHRCSYLLLSSELQFRKKKGTPVTASDGWPKHLLERERKGAQGLTVRPLTSSRIPARPILMLWPLAGNREGTCPPGS